VAAGIDIRAGHLAIPVDHDTRFPDIYFQHTFDRFRRVKDCF
jgi:hypothetical protein